MKARCFEGMQKFAWTKLRFCVFKQKDHWHLWFHLKSYWWNSSKAALAIKFQEWYALVSERTGICGNPRSTAFVNAKFIQDDCSVSFYFYFWHFSTTIEANLHQKWSVLLMYQRERGVEYNRTVATGQSWWWVLQNFSFHLYYGALDDRYEY